MQNYNFAQINGDVISPRDSLPDLKQALQTAWSNNSGASAPSVTFPGQIWFDTATDTYKGRNTANNQWVDLPSFAVAGGALTLQAPAVDTLSFKNTQSGGDVLLETTHSGGSHIALRAVSNEGVTLYHRGLPQLKTDLGALVCETNFNVQGELTMDGAPAIFRNNNRSGRIDFKGTTAGGLSYTLAQFDPEAGFKTFYKNESRITTTQAGALINGTLTATEDVLVSSDRKIKKNIREIDDVLGIFRKIRGWVYDRKDLKSPERDPADRRTERHRKTYTVTQAGVIAQDVNEVFPWAVACMPNGIYTVKQGAMIGLLTEGMHQCIQKIDRLEAKLLEVDHGTTD